MNLRSLKAHFSWTCWEQSSRLAAWSFAQALNDPLQIQNKVFQSILAQAEGSIWANHYKITAQTSLAEFRENVPVQDPSDFEKWTSRMMKGEKNVLINRPTDRLVPTSGTTGKRKLIPLTSESRREFSIGINLWVNNTLSRFPQMKSGRSYIATSPYIDIENDNSSISIGFAKDSEYLGAVEKFILSHISSIPFSVSQLRGSEWRIATRNHLLATKDLTFLSLWHPSYIESLFERAELANLKNLWPKLAVISCWADGACADAASRLLSYFPQAQLIPKGIWLTEGIISLPWNEMYPIALPCGFFEFEAEGGNICGIDGLIVGHTYRPVLSNHAGLYRYRLGDLIRVTGFIKQTPCVRWVGRADQISDLCGEKLSEAGVSAAIDSLGSHENAFFLPICEGLSQFYLFITSTEKELPVNLDSLDQILKKNIHYQWARELGQLDRLRHIEVDNSKLSEALEFISIQRGEHRKATRLIPNDYVQTVLDILDISRVEITR
ncbi:MAG: GH3 auxin-responsive promoter family protein [Verrucomicrobiota bacterium]